MNNESNIMESLSLVSYVKAFNARKLGSTKISGSRASTKSWVSNHTSAINLPFETLPTATNTIEGLQIQPLIPISPT